MAYWDKLHGWYADDGHACVAGYLQKLDLSGFDPKAPPPKTAAFHEIVGASRAPEDAELADILEALGQPEAVTLDTIHRKASTMERYEFAQWLCDRKNAGRFRTGLRSVATSGSRIPMQKTGFSR